MAEREYHFKISGVCVWTFVCCVVCCFNDGVLCSVLSMIVCVVFSVVDDSVCCVQCC